MVPLKLKIYNLKIWAISCLFSLTFSSFFLESLDWFLVFKFIIFSLVFLFLFYFWESSLNLFLKPFIEFWYFLFYRSKIFPIWEMHFRILSFLVFRELSVSFKLFSPSCLRYHQRSVSIGVLLGWSVFPDGNPPVFCLGNIVWLPVFWCWQGERGLGISSLSI